MIAPLLPQDWPQVRAVYEAAIAGGDSTFETSAPSWEAWDASHLHAHRLAARDAHGRLIGWAAVSPVSDRCAYAGVVEVSVYVAPHAVGRGVGGALLEALVASTEAGGVWTLEARIFPENTASLRLHQRCGFRVVGVHERRGQLNGVWRDVVLLERRSDIAGVH